MNLIFTWDVLREIAHGRWALIDPAGDDIRGITGISTDTRNIGNGELFLALTGDRFDGHKFIDVAVNNGAGAVCAHHISESQSDLLKTKNIPCLLVCNTLEAYQDLAGYHRSRFPQLIVIGITGSSGKTSTKEIIATILDHHFGGHVLKTAGNTNNQIGVPQNLLKLTPDHRVAVLELGTNSPGEIGRLVEIVRPNIAVLTNIGPVHLEGLGDLEGVILEKASIFSRFYDNQGMAILPRSLRRHPQISTALGRTSGITFGDDKTADIQVRYLGGRLDSSEFEIVAGNAKKPVTFSWNLSGAHLALNAGAGFAVADRLKVDRETIVQALRECRLPNMRMQVIWKDKICWINDAYNANPDSVKAFILWLQSLIWDARNLGMKYVVLGDMLELGAGGDALHTEVLTFARKTLSDMELLPVGKIMAGAAATAGMKAFVETEDLKRWLLERLASGDTVALKGSRGMALESIIP